jgi:hypothetical protein
LGYEGLGDRNAEQPGQMVVAAQSGARVPGAAHAAGVRALVAIEGALVVLCIFDVSALIATISADAHFRRHHHRRTPVGVDIGFKRPKFLKQGDVVAMKVDGIGRLSNPVQ